MDINNFFLGNLADGLTEVMNGIMDFLMISIEAIYKLGERVALGSELSAINIGTIGIEKCSSSFKDTDENLSSLK